MASWKRRSRIGLLMAVLAGAGLIFHQEIIGRLAYAVEKGQLEAGRENLAKVEDISELFRAVARQVRPTVVLITTTSATEETGRRRNIDPRDLPEPFRQFFEEFGDGPFESPSPPSQRSSGSGVIIDAEKGYILTNNHVVSEGENVKTRIDVKLPDGRRVRGKVLGTDPKTDLALIQISADRLHAAKLGDSSKMEVGDWVLAVGAPFGLDQTVTQGIISATGRHQVGIANYADFLQTDAAINPGNSGGPLVNMRGEVIGINTAIATSGLMSGYMGVGFSIPINMAKEILPYLERGEEVVRGYLGVHIRGLDTFESGIGQTFGLKEDTGVLVEDVMPGTPASKAGLKMDDIILEYDGQKVESATQLQHLVARTKPGTEVNMRVWRDGREITIPVTVEKQPTNFFDRSALGRRGERGDRRRDGGSSAVEETTIDTIGVTVEPLTDATARRYGWGDDPSVRGMFVVTKVDPLGEAAALGIAVGDLIVNVQGEPVESARDLLAALDEDALAKGVRIKIRKPRLGYTTLFLQVNP